MRNGEVILLVSVILMLAGPMLVGLVHIICGAFVQVCTRWKDADLKIKLADRGFSADEIERILMAGKKVKKRRRAESDPDELARKDVPRKPPKVVA